MDKPEQQPETPEQKELREKLEALWTVCPVPGHGQENDVYIDGVDSDEAGASRLVGSGESGPTGSEVRIKFRQSKR
jgi:hypothetical protein